jgi:hypothetical protein
MKSNFLIFSFVMLAFITNAQNSFGVKTSVGIIPIRPETVYAGNESDFVTHEITTKSASPVISGGLFVKKVMGWSFVQMDAMYSSYSLNYDMNSFGGRVITPEVVTEKFKTVDLVINAGITSNNLRLGFGPIFHLMADHQSAFDAIPTYNERMAASTVGFSGSVGYDIGNLAIDMRYENALGTIGDHIFFGSARSKFKTGANQITLSVGYGF